MPTKIIKNKAMNIFGADASLSLRIADKYPNLVADVRHRDPICLFLLRNTYGITLHQIVFNVLISLCSNDYFSEHTMSFGMTSTLMGFGFDSQRGALLPHLPMASASKHSAKADFSDE